MTGTQQIECFKIPIYPIEDRNILNLLFLEHRYYCSAPKILTLDGH